MFRPKKKRPANHPNRIRSLLADDDSSNDDDNEGAVKMNTSKSNVAVGSGLIGDESTSNKNRKKKRVLKGNDQSRPMSFEIPDDLVEDDGEVCTTKKRKKSRDGLGFGGVSHFHDNEDEDQSNTKDSTSNDGRALDAMSALYDKDSLATLLSEQKRLEDLRQQGVDEQQQSNNSEQPSKSNLNPAFPDFIPMNSSSEMLSQEEREEQILVGEEALNLLSLKRDQEKGWLDSNQDYYSALNFSEAKHRQKPFSNYEDKGSSSEDEEVRETNAAWEAEVERRAGVSISTANQEAGPDKSDGPVIKCVKRGPRKSLSMLQLRTKIAQSLEELEVRKDDIDRAMSRREAELEHTKAEAQKQEEELKRAGTALEYYQQWRERLINWVGAVRDLKEKVEPLLTAFHDLEGERVAYQRWQDWEDDMIAILHEHNVLDRVVGRQPPVEIFRDNLTTVDEFGRDVKSQHVLQRDQRRRKRERIQAQRKRQQENASPLDATQVINCGGESDGFVSEEEEESFRERHGALKKALVVATDELDEEYTMLHNLVKLFEEWYKAYPEEYKQSYASLSLADLACVLVQVELCALNDPWNESAGYNEAKWTTVIRSALDAGIMDENALERLMERSVIPAITDALDKKGINVASAKQMKAIARFMTHIHKLLPEKSQSLRQIHARLIVYVNEQLKEIAIPIVNHEAAAAQSSTDEELADALYIATEGQMRRIKKMLLNLLTHWAPIMPKDLVFVDSILHFISDKYLVLLSSIKKQRQVDATKEKEVHSVFAESPADAFRDIMDVLVPTGWLDWPELMLETAPIRAAATAFRIDE